MQLKVKRLSEKAVLPSRANPGDAGLDITCISVSDNFQYHECKTGLAFEIPSGHVGLLFARSSVTTKTLMLKNAVGVIDSSYRGEVTFRFYNTHQDNVLQSRYKPGDKVGQLIIIPYPEVQVEEASELSETIRGSGGYGSSGV